jgi:hypothetical protein
MKLNNVIRLVGFVVTFTLVITSSLLAELDENAAVRAAVMKLGVQGDESAFNQLQDENADCSNTAPRHIGMLAIHNELARLKFLQEHGADLSIISGDDLGYVAALGYTEMLAYLVSQDADLTKVPCEDLYWVAKHDTLEIVELFQSAGVDLDPYFARVENSN